MPAPCHFHQKAGDCRKGAACPFSHQAAASSSMTRTPSAQQPSTSSSAAQVRPRTTLQSHTFSSSNPAKAAFVKHTGGPPQPSTSGGTARSIPHRVPQLAHLAGMPEELVGLGGRPEAAPLGSGSSIITIGRRPAPSRPSQQAVVPPHLSQRPTTLPSPATRRATPSSQSDRRLSGSTRSSFSESLPSKASASSRRLRSTPS